MLRTVDYLEIHTHCDHERQMFYDYLQYHMEEETFEIGEEIINATQRIEHLYFMLEGFAQIEIMVNDEIHKMDVLKSADIFCQYKMLVEGKPNFTVTAIS